MKKHTIKLLTVAITLATILTLTGCPGPVNTIEPPVWDDGVVTTEPTCTTEGEKTYTCSNGETRTETIPALGHDMGDKWEITKNPTCTEEGSKTRKCSRCGETETVEIDALGHDHIVTYSDNICTTPGTKTTTCSRCDYSVTENIDALGHSYIWITTKIATKTEHGEKIHKCSRCSHIDETEVIHNFEAGGCDICGAYQNNEEDDYQIMAYVYSSEDDALNSENERVLYFSFPKDTTGIPQIVIGEYGPEITINNLIQMKSGYVGKTVKYFAYTDNSLSQKIEENRQYQRDTKRLTNLENKNLVINPIYIVVE